MTNEGETDVGVREVTDEEVAHFEADGWAVLRDFVSPDTTARMLSEAKASMGENADGELDGEQYSDFGWWKNFHYLAHQDEREPFRSVVFSATMRRNVQRLIGRDLDIRYFVDEVACKMPQREEVGSGITGWHQDLPHYPHDRVGHVGFWLALDDVPPERGSLRFLSGGHREGPLGRDFGLGNPDVLARYPELADRYEVSPPVHLRPGDATCHASLTIHSAPANSTDEPRWAYIFTYFPDDVLYNGAYHRYCEGLGLEVNKPFDHPRFPLIPS